MSRRVCCCAVLFQILIVVSLAHDAAAFWGGRGGAAICTAPQAQHQLAGIPDGTGGAIFAWTDRRDEVESQIYAQRFDASGSAQWGTNGIMIASFASNQDSPTIATDDAGGAIIVWSDTRILSGRQIFAQKINPMGNAVWSPQGVRVCPGSAQTQRLPRVIPDGAGGAFTAWEDYRYGATPVAWTQRLDANGTILWGTGGKQPTPSADPTKEQGAIAFVTDAAGGFIITFHDHRGFGFDIYAQRMAPDGSLLWDPSGVPVATGPTSLQNNPHPVADGLGGAIIVWSDDRDGSRFDIRGQRLDASGTRQWAPLDAGVPVAACPGDQGGGVRIVSDGDNGAIVAWTDHQIPSSDYDVMAQRISGTGSSLWGPCGLPVANTDSVEYEPSLVSDGSGGAFITWTHAAPDADILPLGSAVYALRLLPDGSPGPGYPPQGGDITGVRGNQQRSLCVFHPSGRQGGAIVAWDDNRDSPTNDQDLYVTRVYGDMVAVEPATQVPGSVVSLRATPNPTRNEASFRIELATPGPMTLRLFDLSGRVVATLADNQILRAGVTTFEWKFESNRGPMFPEGIFFARAEYGAQIVTTKVALIR